MSNLVTELNSGRVLLMDGAMGTELQQVANPFARCAEQYNLIDPQAVAKVHSAYSDAGAQTHLTNTFQANPVVLARFGLEKNSSAIWQAAIRLAGQQKRLVLASVGPFSRLTDTLVNDIWRECINIDGVVLETWSSIDHLKRFANHRHRPLAPLLVSFTFCRGHDGTFRTFKNKTPETCARAAQECTVVAMGANCGKDIDMTDMLEIVKRYHDVCELPIFVRPNAGTPKRVGSHWIYPRSPKQMARGIPALLEEGIAMLGGCCGVGPDYIRRFAKVLQKWNVSS